MTQKEVEQGIGILFGKLTIVENNRLIYKQLTELCGIGKQFECVMEKSKFFWQLTVSSLCFSIITESIYDGFSWGDIEDLIEVANEIINRISIGLTGCEYIIQSANYDDVSYLIKNAYKGMKNIDKLNN